MIESEELDKEKKLKEIKENCMKANLPLKESATNIVFGKGNPYAEIMFIGEAAGMNEDLRGLPFVGAAGKNLDKLLNSVGLSLEKVYITNILKYRPPLNRDPLPDEIKAHTPWLIEQIKQIRPKVICSLGNYATKFFLAGGNVDLMEKQPGIKLIPLFHPAAIIYKRDLIPLWEKDMEVVKKEVDGSKVQKTLF